MVYEPSEVSFVELLYGLVSCAEVRVLVADSCFNKSGSLLEFISSVLDSAKVLVQNLSGFPS
jgi:hypothetical protein